MLSLSNISVSVEKKKILSNINFSLLKNETHVIFGKNGSGKSSLALTLMGHPRYHVESGKMLFFQESLLEKSPEERSLEGSLVGIGCTETSCW